MIRKVTLVAVLALLAGALIVAQRRHANAIASAQPILYLIADSQRDLVTLPAHFTRISDADEIKYGDRIAQEMTVADSDMTPDRKRIAEYVAAVGKRVAANAHRRLPYRFHFLPARGFVNAFAIPGGHVFIGSGLIEGMTTEDELAAVLAHEVEHIDHYHCAERLQVEAALRKIPLGGVAAIPISVFQAGYDKDHEFEADREGVLLASHAGYSANGALRAFASIERLEGDRQQRARTPQGEAATVAAGAVTGYFASHPPTVDRVAQVRAMIAREPSLAAAAEKRLDVDYIVTAWHALDLVRADEFAKARDAAAQSLARQAGHPDALQALAESDFALGRFANAEADYHHLLAADSAHAAEVGKWCEQRAQNFYDAGRYDDELALAESVLRVQPGEPPLLRLAAFGRARKGDAPRATAFAETMHKLYPEAAAQGAPDAATAAETLFGSGDFTGAIAMADVAVTLDSLQKNATATRGKAEIALAEFDAAAKTFRDRFDPANADAAWLRPYCVALSVARPHEAVAELDAVMAKHDATQIPDGALLVERAGLGIIAGDDSVARDVVQRVKNGTVAPELLAQLAWWYLQANRAADAEGALKAAQSLRPGDGDIRNALAWVALERGKPAEAIAETQSDSADPVRQNGHEVRVALAEWQQGRRTDAMRDWAKVVATRPQWRNPAWRNALYPPHIAETAAALSAAK